MINHAELRVSAPHQTCLVVNVYGLGVEEVARDWRDPFPVRRQHTPRLAAHELHLSLAHIYPVEAEAVGYAITRNGDVPRHSAQKVRFKVANHVRAFHVGVYAEPNPRILRAQANFGKLSCGRVVEWDTAKISADARARVGGAKDR